MIPATFAGLLIVLLAVLPGAAFVWSYERQHGAFNVAVTDRLFRFLGVSAVIQIVALWPEYAIFRLLKTSWPNVPILEFFLSWIVLLVVIAVPALIGSITGWRARVKDNFSRVAFLRWMWRQCREHGFASCLLRTTEKPTRAWDHVFGERQSHYLRVRTSCGHWVGGVYASESYAGGPNGPADLYIENSCTLEGPDKNFGKRTNLGLYVPADKIEYVEVWTPKREEAE